jgi:exoribonuclease R
MKSREGAFHPITVKPNIFLFPASDDDDQINVPWKRSMTPRFTESKPEIVLGYDLAATSRARMMVAEYMIMAGSKMAKFAKETNTPIIYRTQEAIFNSDSTSEGKQSSRDQRIQELLSCVQNGHLPFEKSIQIFGFLEASQMSTIDRPHVMLGLDHYLQATSPLRRAWDLIAHWQIKARLLQIHGHDTQLPFNENELDRMIARMQVRERRLKRLQQRNSQHWIREMFKPRDSSDRGISLYSDMVFEGIVREREQRVEGWNVFVKELASRFIVVDRNLVRGVRLQVGDRILLRVDTSTSDRLDFIQAE